MIARLLSLMILSVLSLSSVTVNPFSQHRLDRFYNLFLEEEAILLDEHGMRSGSLSISDNPTNPPPNPPPPDTFYSGYLPLVIVNNGNFSSDNVYVLISSTADAVECLSIDSNGLGSIVTLGVGQTTNNYVYPLSSMRRTTDGDYVIYVPQIVSARLWISYGSNIPLQMVVNDQGLQEPGFLPTDSTYNYVFDKMEFNFLKGDEPPVFVNATAVDYFSIPIYTYLSGATSPNSNNGLYQKSSSVFNYAKGVFSAQASSQSLSQWNNLFFTSTNSNAIVRLCSPAKGMSQFATGSTTQAIFDSSYLQNGASYGFNFLEDIWTGANGFYRSNDLTIQSGENIYTGRVQGEQIVLTGPGGTITFLDPNIDAGVAPANTWSYQTFANINTQISYNPADINPNLADNILNLFQEAINVGLVPTTETISKNYFSQNKSSYFTNNSQLNTSGTGPWYSLYGKALLGLGNIYVFSVNEDLLPDVLVSGPYVENSTYIGVTLGRY